MYKIIHAELEKLSMKPSNKREILRIHTSHFQVFKGTPTPKLKAADQGNTTFHDSPVLYINM